MGIKIENGRVVPPSWDELLVPCSERPVEAVLPDVTAGIPADAITLIAGESHVGKTSALLAGIVAPYSAGRPTILTDPSDLSVGQANRIVVYSIENTRAELKAILRSAGADLDKITIIDRIDHVAMQLGGRDLSIGGELYQRIAALHPDLFIIDPINRVIPGIREEMRAAVRDMLMNPLTAYAAINHIAVIATTHTRKSTAASVRESISGSGAYFDYTDSVYYLQALPTNRDEICQDVVLSCEKDRHGHRPATVEMHREADATYTITARTRRTGDSYRAEQALRNARAEADAHSVKAADRRRAASELAEQIVRAAGESGIESAELQKRVVSETSLGSRTVADIVRTLIDSGVISRERGAHSSLLRIAEGASSIF